MLFKLIVTSIAGSTWKYPHWPAHVLVPTIEHWLTIKHCLRIMPEASTRGIGRKRELRNSIKKWLRDQKNWWGWIDQSGWPREAPQGLPVPQVASHGLLMGQLRRGGLLKQDRWLSLTLTNQSSRTQHVIDGMRQKYPMYQKVSGNSISLNAK